MKRRFYTTMVLSSVMLGDALFSGALFAATNPTPNPPRPAGGSAPVAPPNANRNTQKANPAPSRSIPGYYSNSSGNYYPSGNSGSNATPSSSSTTPNSTNSNAYRNGYYPGYYSGYYPGYYGYAYPYGSPYGYGYGAPYPAYGYGGYSGAWGSPGVYTGGYGFGSMPYGYSPFANAGQMFGPGPILQMMGVDQWNNPNNNNAAVPPANWNGGAAGNAPAAVAGNNAAANNAVANNAGGDVIKPADHPPPGRALAVAWKFIGYGDGYFAKKKYLDASERYRTASRQTATVADAWFRQGFALAALGKYDQSAKAFRHGLEINPDWATSDFHLNELYGSDDDEKKAKIADMMAAAVSDPTNADVNFVVGIHLYFDGRPDQAAPYFRKSAQVSGSDADIKGFASAK